MRIRKYEAGTEQEAVEKARSELGNDAVILNIRTTRPRGMFALFRKTRVEVTAAFDDSKRLEKEKTEERTVDAEPEKLDNSGFDEYYLERIQKDRKIQEQSEKIQWYEERLSTTAGMLEKVSTQRPVMRIEKVTAVPRKYKNNMVQVMYETLLDQEVMPEVAESILNELDSVAAEISENGKQGLNLFVKIVYNAIIKILGEPEPIDPDYQGGSAKVIYFIGSTGVGKTTTIAKLSADFILNQQINVGLITCDTYRIAAVEQLKVYADILSIELSVAYSTEDLAEKYENLKDKYEIILIDTAGRSHKNVEALTETSEIINAIPDSEKYLVLSLATKFDDIIEIAREYDGITDYRLIFTKRDETEKFGSILNVCYATGKKLSYITTGQNVPDDIEIIRPDTIAKSLLGLGE